MVTYNRSFIILLAFQYFNQGCKAMLGLAVKNYYKEYLNLEPGYITKLSSIAGFPWSVKILYGIVSDNVPIFGSKRKSYVVIMGLLQFVSLIVVFLFEVKDEKYVTALLFMASLSGAYLDVLVDALMVI
jgi:hypothetical protein